jgi:Cu+-exporting ATPase
MGQGEHAGGEVVCDAHPEVRFAAGEECPTCAAVAAAAEETVGDVGARFWVACAFTVVAAAIAAARALSRPGEDFRASAASLVFLELAVTAIGLGWALWPFVGSSWSRLRAARLPAFLPLLLALTALLLWSLVAAVAPASLPASARAANGQVPYFFVTALAVATLVLGRLFWEQLGRQRAGSFVQSLLEARPTVARVVRSDGGEDSVAVRFVEPGDRIRVLAGERVPVDGEVVEGTAVVDESELLTSRGEVEKHPGEPVLAGTVNGRETLLVRAVRAGGDSMLVRLGKAVDDAQRTPVFLKGWAATLQRRTAAATLATAAVVCVAVALTAASPSLARALVAAVVILVAVAPRMMAMAAQLPVATGLCRGARGGVIVAGAAALERLGRVNTVIVDRAGMLMEGKPQLTTLIALPPWEEPELLAIAASLERENRHPIGAALRAAADASGLPLEEARGARLLAGKGIVGIVGSHKVAIGGRALLEELQMPEGELLSAAQDLRREAQSVLYVLVDERLAGLLGMTDVAATTIPETLQNLHDRGVQVVMLTGDSRTTGAAVARDLGVDGVVAEVQAGDKAQVVRRVRRDEGRVVALVSQGGDDAEALASADVGMVTDSLFPASGEAGDVILAGPKLTAVVAAVRLGQQVRRTVRRGLMLVIATTAVAITAAVLAAAFAPFLPALPVLAAAAPLLCLLALRAMAARLRETTL